MAEQNFRTIFFNKFVCANPSIHSIGYNGRLTKIWDFKIRRDHRLKISYHRL